MGRTILIHNDLDDFIIVTICKGETGYSTTQENETIVKRRNNESLETNKTLRIKKHIFLNNPCQDLQNSLKNYYIVIKYIRKCRPIQIYIHKSPIKHRVYLNFYDPMTEAWWNAGENTLPDLGKSIHVPELYIFEVTDLFEFPSYIVDIGDISTKINDF